MYMSDFIEINDNSLINIDGGTFFGVCQGICICAVGTATFIGGVGASSLGVGIPACIFGAATYADGIATIVNNM